MTRGLLRKRIHCRPRREEKNEPSFSPSLFWGILFQAFPDSSWEGNRTYSNDCFERSVQFVYAGEDLFEALEIPYPIRLVHYVPRSAYDLRDNKGSHTSAMSPTRTSRCCSKYALLLLLFEPLAVLRVSIVERQKPLFGCPEYFFFGCL